jgi:uncharacterized protein YbjT (DUF2867 family)
MYVVLGATGNTGSVVARKLLAQGQPVRAVGRSATHLQPLAAQGAETAVTDLAAAAALAQAFQGAHSAYVMVPPNPTSHDVLGDQRRVIDSIVAAVKNAGVKNLVALSSFGSEQSSGTGLIATTHEFEGKLEQLENINILLLRAGSFMENTLAQAGVIKHMNAMVGPTRADLKVPMIATRDIGNFAADALLKLHFHGKQTQELQGHRDLDYTEAASIIGQAIAKPDLKYMQAPPAQFKSAMLQMGMSENFADLYLKMADALNSGHMKMLEPRSPRNTTPTPFETFVSETFVPVYQHQQAA